MLQRDGVFEESIFDDLGLPFVKSLFTPRDFLLLLQYLFVVSPIKGSDSTVQRFFMPIVLPPERMSEEQKKAFTAKCDPLVITFNSKLVLQGLFPTLIVSLLSRKEKPYFFIDSRSKNFPQQLRYAVSLYSEDLFGSIFLCDNLKSIEIIFTGLTRDCYTLRQVILECLSASAELLSYDMKALKISALPRCTRKHTILANDSDPHPITISYKETPPVIGCSVETLPVELLNNEKQSRWLLDSCTSSAPLTNACTNMPLEETAAISSTTSATVSTMIPLAPVQNTVVADTSVADTLPVETAVLNMSHAPLLIKAIRTIVFEWEILGTQLDIEPCMLQQIKYNCRDQVQVCRKEMIYHWIETGTATLQKLIEGLGVVGRNDVVADINKLK
ncbi:PREDICTED: uncharacterized protein LOC109585754 [Amphimedon queenslandica]|uniref:Death domain-containing protein n=2 Tax=Amphimedon queenslandica TaxID=400682 RepID=A0AAN0JKX8_AMPQE|nr:PREDICTED: uncharacterized protein LOC109585754 [Amphimedon queenslandica]|eukprot:XP_019857439.1 PREDICTED: uncharacterized protein LOC109585754 [Amphimedon queenslandica]